MEMALQAERELVRRMQARGGVREGFLAMDRRGDGVITAPELREAAGKTFGLDLPPEVADAIVRRHPGPSADSMSYQTFAELYDGVFTRWVTSASAGVGSNLGVISPLKVEAAPETEAAQEARLRDLIASRLQAHVSSDVTSQHFAQMFLNFDVDRTGRLTYDELRLGLCSLGLALASDDFLTVLRIVDPQCTGSVDLYSFLSLMGRVVGSRGALSPDSFSEDAQKAPRPSQVYYDAPAVPRALAGGVDDAAPTPKVIQSIVTALSKTNQELVATFKKICPGGVANAEVLSDGFSRVGIDLSVANARKLIAAIGTDGAATIHYHQLVKLISTSMAEARSGGEEGESEPHDRLGPEMVKIISDISTRVYSDFTKVRDAFAAFDKDGQHRISQQELKEGMRKGGFSTFSDEDAAEVIATFDVSKTGNLTYREFVLVLAAASSGTRPE